MSNPDQQSQVFWINDGLDEKPDLPKGGTRRLDQRLGTDGVFIEDPTNWQLLGEALEITERWQSWGAAEPRIFIDPAFRPRDNAELVSAQSDSPTRSVASDREIDAWMNLQSYIRQRAELAGGYQPMPDEGGPYE